MSEKLKATPGGTLAPEHVFGRDELIAQLWGILDSNSVLLTAERRVGKTSVIRKMCAQPKAGKLVYWWDVSSVQTAGEFAQGVYERVEVKLSTLNIAMTRGRKLLSDLGGAQVSVVKIPDIAAQHWKTLLEKTVADLVEHCGREVVFLWDEVPWMLEKIVQGAATPVEGERLAMELLDTLRALRQTHLSLRMVFAGSIGLHHVLSALREKGYGNSPINDMTVVEVPPHSLPDARALALELLRNEAIPLDDENAVALALAQGVGGFAFYIHLLVVQMRPFHGRGERVTAAKVEGLIAQALEDDQDRWQLRHYLDRLPHYYDARATQARAILDEVAAARAPLSLPALLNALRAQSADVEKETTLDVLDLLRRDHYLTLENGVYLFRYALVGRFWRTHRGLSV